MKRVLISVGIFVGLLAIVAVVMEVTATARQQAMRYFRTRSVFQYQPGNVVYDPALGYRLTPGLDVAFTNAEFSTRVRTNTIGFRDDDASLQGAQVWFLGDSYSFGWGVEEPDGVEKQYERATGKRVLNMSVPGYSNIQEMLMLMKWAHASPVTGIDVYLFLSSNDFIDNENTSFDAFPYFVEQGGSIALAKPLEASFSAWQETVNRWMITGTAARKSMLAYYAAAAVKNLSVRDVYSGYRSGKTAVPGNKAFLLVTQQLAQFAKERQSRVTVVYIPPTSGNKAAQQLPFLRKVCGTLGLRLLDLSPVLTAGDYYPLDKHWTPAGHAKVAAWLVQQP